CAECHTIRRRITFPDSFGRVTASQSANKQKKLERLKNLYDAKLSGSSRPERQSIRSSSKRESLYTWQRFVQPEMRWAPHFSISQPASFVLLRRQGKTRGSEFAQILNR